MSICFLLLDLLLFLGNLRCEPEEGSMTPEPQVPFKKLLRSEAEKPDSSDILITNQSVKNAIFRQCAKPVDKLEVMLVVFGEREVALAVKKLGTGQLLNQDRGLTSKMTVQHTRRLQVLRR